MVLEFCEAKCICYSAWKLTAYRDPFSSASGTTVVVVVVGPGVVLLQPEVATCGKFTASCSQLINRDRTKRFQRVPARSPNKVLVLKHAALSSSVPICSFLPPGPLDYVKKLLQSICHWLSGHYSHYSELHTSKITSQCKIRYSILKTKTKNKRQCKYSGTPKYHCTATFQPRPVCGTSSICG